MNILKLKRRIKQVIDTTTYYFLLPVAVAVGKRYKNTWLISERGFDARDNGYFFYLYLKEKHPEIHVKYVISSTSADRSRISENDIVCYRSISHYFYYVSACVLVSTHYQGYSPNLELYSQLDCRGLIYTRGKKIFLQHGIAKENLGWSKKNRRVDMLVCSVRGEYDALLKETDYGTDVIKMVGLPRFDRLFKKIGSPTKRSILVMPTWRMKFTNMSMEDFINSDYYSHFSSLLTNSYLLSLLEKHDYVMEFYPHIEMQKYLSLFTKYESERVRILGISSADVQSLLIESSILITDYSSVYFDFAYLNKPLIYYQFDYEDYIKTHHRPGWFDTKKDGFGPVYDDINSIVSYVERILNFGIEEKYIQRINKCFNLRDDRNCDRTYSEIIKKVGCEIE